MKMSLLSVSFSASLLGGVILLHVSLAAQGAAAEEAISPSQAQTPAAPAASSTSSAPSRTDDESGENPVSQPSPGGGEANATESLLKMRDPFKRPDVVVDEGAPKSELELYASHQFQLVGVMTGPRQIRAILQSPTGKTFFVKVGDHLGQRRGVVERITPEKLLVQEKIVNVLGQAENITTEIKLNLGGKLGMSLYPVSPPITGIVTPQSTTAKSSQPTQAPTQTPGQQPGQQTDQQGQQKK